jgi:hypothetical protein
MLIVDLIGRTPPIGHQKVSQVRMSPGEAVGEPTRGARGRVGDVREDLFSTAAIFEGTSPRVPHELARAFSEGQARGILDFDSYTSNLEP